MHVQLSKLRQSKERYKQKSIWNLKKHKNKSSIKGFLVDLNFPDITYPPLPFSLSLSLRFSPSLPFYSLGLLKHVWQCVRLPHVILTFFFILAQDTVCSLLGLIYCIYVYGRVGEREYMNFMRTL